MDSSHVRLTPGSADRQHPAAKVQWPTEEPPGARDPAESPRRCVSLGASYDTDSLIKVLEQLVRATLHWRLSASHAAPRAGKDRAEGSP